jgi:cation:H+ antiporter
MDYIAIIFGLYLLIIGGDWLLKSAVSISLKFKIPKIVIGMTIVSFATSAPELIVSVKSALQGYPDLALGNVLGSNIANLALVLGTVILISPIQVTDSFYKMDWPIMIVSSILFYLFILNDGILSQIEGGFLFVMLICFLIFLLFFQQKAVLEEVEESLTTSLAFSQVFFFLLFGGLFLWLGSEVLIKGAVGLATSWGVSERIISISIVSVGTSIPELSASVIAILKKEKALSIGNLIGSNIFNVLAVMGITALIHPIQMMDQDLLNIDFIWMLFVSFLILPLVFFPSKMKLGTWEGFVLLGLYGLFLFKMFN